MFPCDDSSTTPPSDTVSIETNTIPGFSSRAQ